MASTESLMIALRNGRRMTRAEELLLVTLLSIPAVLAQIASVLMSYIDSAMLGHLGSEEAAAVGLVSTTIWLLWGVASCAITGYHVLVGQAIGKNDLGLTRALHTEAITVTVGVGIVIAFIGISIGGALPGWLGARGEVARLASEYFYCYCFGLPIVMLNILETGMLRVSGDMKTPSVLNVFMCVANVCLNFIFIFPTHTYSIFGLDVTCFGLNLGVKGAALATIVSTVIILIPMGYIAYVRDDKLRLFGFRLNFFRLEAVRRAFAISVPVSFQRILMTGAQIVTTIVVAPLGTAAIAAHSFAITAESVCYMPGFGIREAATTLTAQTTGARHYDSTQRFAGHCIWLGVAVMTLVGVFMYFAAESIIGMMTENPEIIALGAAALKIEAFAEPFYAASIVAYGCFIGAGDALIPSLMNLFSMWIVRVPLLIWLTGSMGFIGIWIAMALELFIRGVIFFIRYRFCHWTYRPRETLTL